MLSLRQFSKVGTRAIKRKSRSSRSNRLAAILWGLLVTVVFIGGLVIGFMYYLKTTFEGPGPLAADIIYTVEKGDSVTVIAQNLMDKGYISDARVFILGFYLNKETGTLKAGEFPLNANVSMEEIIRIFRSGKSVAYKVTLPEGLTSQQIVDRLNQDTILTGTIEETPKEGSLLPETYAFQRGTSRQELLERMVEAQRVVLEKAWEERIDNLPLESPEEAVILASIVEKETGQSGERRRVAAVFINRLNKSMRLQSDPTIIYGIMGPKGALGRPIRQSEIDAATPYNTYQIDGLPPTPITNPGRAAIEAVLHPVQSEELFFVADGTGGHLFAKTLKEHNINVAKYRIWQKQQKNQSAVPAAPEIPPVPKSAVVPAQ